LTAITLINRDFWAYRTEYIRTRFSTFMLLAEFEPAVSVLS